MSCRIFVAYLKKSHFRCHAENELGSAWTEGPIIVTLVGAPKPDGEAPDFVQPVRPVVVRFTSPFVRRWSPSYLRQNLM